jgi:hypothetical protein
VAASTDDGTRPLFRSYAPTSSGLRTFPSLTYILNNANTPPTTYACSGGTCLTGETLPTTSRAMRFIATIRDNRSGGGAITTAEIAVTSTTAAGPFRVTSPNTAVTIGGAQTVTWNVAGTTAAPVSTANVRILLSTDGGTTFSTELAASTANDGTEVVILPSTTTSTARIKIEAVGNVYFDISDTNFSITPAAALTFTDSPLVASTTAVKAVHITELRTAINTARVRYGLLAQVWTDPTLTAGTTTIKAVHLTEMRTALSAAYVASGRVAPTYSPVTVTAGTTTVTAAQITELRNFVLVIY